LFVAEQTRLLVRLAADTGARRGEMRCCASPISTAVLLTIERGLSWRCSDDQDSQKRRVTLGATTTAMIVEHFESWRQRVGVGQVVGDSIFSATSGA